MKVLICDLKGEALNYALARVLDECPYVNDEGEVWRTFICGEVGRWNPTETLAILIELLTLEGFKIEDLFPFGLSYNGDYDGKWEAECEDHSWYESESFTDLIAQQWIRHLTGKDKIKIKRKVLEKLGHVFEHEVSQVPLFTLVVNAPPTIDPQLNDKLREKYGPYRQFADRVQELSTSEFQVVCEFFDRKLLVLTTLTECQPLVPSTRIEWDEFVKDL